MARPPRPTSSQPGLRAYLATVPVAFARGRPPVLRLGLRVDSGSVPPDVAVRGLAERFLGASRRSFSARLRALNAHSAFNAADCDAARQDFSNTTGPRPRVYRAPCPRLCCAIRRGRSLVMPQYRVASRQRSTYTHQRLFAGGRAAVAAAAAAGDGNGDGDGACRCRGGRPAFVSAVGERAISSGDESITTSRHPPSTNCPCSAPGHHTDYNECGPMRVRPAGSPETCTDVDHQTTAASELPRWPP